MKKFLALAIVAIVAAPAMAQLVIVDENFDAALGAMGDGTAATAQAISDPYGYETNFTGQDINAPFYNRVLPTGWRAYMSTSQSDIAKADFGGNGQASGFDSNTSALAISGRWAASGGYNVGINPTDTSTATWNTDVRPYEVGAGQAPDDALFGSYTAPTGGDNRAAGIYTNDGDVSKTLMIGVDTVATEDVRVFAIVYDAYAHNGRNDGWANINPEVNGVGGTANLSVTQSATGDIPLTGLSYDTSFNRVPPIHLGTVSGIVELDTAVTAGANIAVKWQMGDSKNIGIAIDNVKVVKAAAGDTDGDLDFDGTDVVNLNAGAKFLNGAATWGEGDFTGDSLFNGNDVVAMNATALFNTGSYAAVQAGPGAAGDGLTTLIYDPTTGNITLETEGATLNGFQLVSASGIFTGDAANLQGLLTIDSDVEINGGFGGAYADGYDLGNVAALGLDLATLEADLAASVVTISGTPGVFDVNIAVVPEPMTMSLLAIGGLVAIRRRRR